MRPSQGGGTDISTLGTTVAAIFSIALGTLVGWSVFATIRARLGRREAAADVPGSPAE